jgi:hypothetical protein
VHATTDLQIVSLARLLVKVVVEQDGWAVYGWPGVLEQPVEVASHLLINATESDRGDEEIIQVLGADLARRCCHNFSPFSKSIGRRRARPNSLKTVAPLFHTVLETRGMVRQPSRAHADQPRRLRYARNHPRPLPVSPSPSRHLSKQPPGIEVEGLMASSQKQRSA